MTAETIVTELTKLANPQTKKTWMNHGAKEPCLGVKIEDMKKIVKRVKMDYQLALDLYDTGIADACYLAGLIAVDAKMTKKDLTKWMKGATTVWVSEYTVPWVAAASPHGREMAIKWIESKDETIASAGWGTFRSIVAFQPDEKLDLDEIKSLIARVEKEIHGERNRVKLMMNSFIVAVGCHVKPLHKLAVDTAKRIGKVSVDMADDCKVAFAPEQIKKFAARSEIGKKRASVKC